MKERVKRYYEKRAESYEDLDQTESIVSYVRAVGIEDHLKKMRLKKGDFVLDVGCGQGRFLRPFKSMARAVGIDFTLEMLKKASEAGALLLKADAEHLPIKDEVFSVVHSAGLLGIYKSPKICMEMSRVLRKGGRLFISFPAANSFSGVIATAFMKIGWNPTLLDFWYSKEEISSMFPSEIQIKNYHRLGFEPPFQRLYKNIRSRTLVRTFMFVERKLRDKPFFKYLGARFLVEAVKRGP